MSKPCTDFWKSNRPIRFQNIFKCIALNYFFDTAPSYEARETHRYLKNRLGIVRARGGGLWDHPYAPCHPPFVPPRRIIRKVTSQTTVIRWVVVVHIFYIPLLLFALNLWIDITERRSGLSTWKYQFSYDHWSQAMLCSVSTWMRNCSSVAWVLKLTLKVG